MGENGTTKISELIVSLTKVMAEHGDLKVVMAYAPFKKSNKESAKEPNKAEASQDENIYIDTNHDLKSQVKPTELYIQNFPY